MRKIVTVANVAAPTTGFANSTKPANTPAPAPAAKPAAERVAPIVTEIVSLDLPANLGRSRGSESSYPFASLEVGKVFGVQNKDKRAMSSIVSNQNKKYREVEKDANGNPVFNTTELKQPDGSTIQVADTKSPKTIQTRKFEVVEVTDQVAAMIKDIPALAGAKVLVRRTK